MKKFISALSSFVIASTAMGGTFAMTANALYKDVIGGTNASTILEVRYDGTAALNADGTIAAKAGDSVPLAMYIPQSNGFNTISIKMSINGNKTLGEGIENHNGTPEKNEYSYSNYGIVLEAVKTEDYEAYTVPNQLVSGLNKFERTKGKKTDGAGDAAQYGNSQFIGDSMNMLFMAEDYAKTDTNVDSNLAYQVAGCPAYDTFTGATEWTEAEYKKWIASTPELSFAKFNMVLPSNLPDGTYELTLVDEYVPYVAIWDKADGKLKAGQTEPGKVKSVVSGCNKAGTEAVDRKIEFRGVTVKVGEGSTGSTTTSATTTSGTTTTTSATTNPTGSTTSATSTSQTTGGTTVTYTTEAVPADAQIVYQLVKYDNEYAPLVNAKPGEKVTVACILATDDPGTAGLKLTMDFSAITKAGGKIDGDVLDEEAYKVSPESDTAKPDNVSFVFAVAKEQTAKKGAAICSVDLVMPTTPGTYVVKAGSILDTVNLDMKSYKVALQGFTFNVTDGSSESSTTTTTTTSVSTTSGTTTTVSSTTSGTTTSATSTTSGTTTTSFSTTTTTTLTPGSLLLGDVNCNGAVSIADVVRLNKALAGKTTLDDQAKKNADADQNGTQDTQDSILIREWLAGLKQHPTLGSLI